MGVRSRRSRPFASLALACLWIAAAGRGFGEPPDVPVVEVAARPELVSKWELRRLVAFKLGEMASEEQIQQSVQTLMSTERLASVEVERETVKGGERLVFVLRPQPFVRRIRIRGAQQVSKRKIRTWLPFRYYDKLDESLVARAKDVLGDRYVQAGFDRPQVRVSEEPLGRNGGQRVVVEIKETLLPGLAGQVRLENRPGALQIHERLWMWWKNRQDHLWSSPALNPVDLKDHVDRAVSYLKGIGFVEARGVLRIDYDGGRAHGVAHLEAGKRIVLRPSGGGSGERHALEALFWDGGLGVSEKDLTRFVRKAQDTIEDRGYVGGKVRVGVSETAKNKVLDIAIEGGVATTVRHIEMDGNLRVSAADLRAAMLTEEKGWIPFLGAPYRPAVLATDVKALEALYAVRGFPAAQVETHVDVAPSGDVTVHVRVEEGPHQSVGRVEVSGQTELDETQLRGLMEGAGLRTGADLSRSVLSLAAQAVTLEYARRGYPEVRLRVRPLGSQGEVTDLEVEIDEGQRQRCGELVAVGNFKTSPKTMLRRSGCREGDPLDPSGVARLRARQIDLGVFDSVLVEPVLRSGDSYDVLVRAHERRSGTLDLSLLLDSAFGLGVEGSLGHENLFGRALAASLEAGVAATGLRKDSIQLLRFGGSLRKPTFLGWPVPTTLSTVYSFDRSAADRETRQVEVSLAAARSYLAKKLQLSLAVSLKDVRQTLKTGFSGDPNDPLQDNRTFSLAPRLVFDDRNDFTNPTKGSLSSLRVRYAPPILGGENNFVSVEGDTRRYLSLGHRLTLAAALRGGVALALAGQDEVPSSDRFFLGGDTTHRAFPFGELGPRTSGGALLGGTSFLLANAELRFPVFGQFYGGLFTDLGNVFAQGTPFELRPGFGVGLRYYTIIGPIRADVGWNPRPRTFAGPGDSTSPATRTERSFVIHLALGHAF
jgi:outer membrane protein assembly complex protein YaeT